MPEVHRGIKVNIRKLVLGESQASRIERLLERIAIALEAQAGIALPGTPVGDREHEVETSYSNNAELLAEEWDQAMQNDAAEDEGRKPQIDDLLPDRF